MNYPDGYIVKPETLSSSDSFIVYGAMDKTGYVSKGYKLYIPNLNNSGGELKNSLFLKVAGFLSKLEKDCRVQFRFTRDTDYNEMLEKYKEQTEYRVKDCWTQKTRENIYNGFKEQINKRLVRRDHVCVYFSVPINKFLNDNLLPESKKSRERFERQVQNAFVGYFGALKAALQIEITPLSHIELFKEFHQAYNKSAMESNIDYAETFIPQLGDISQCEFAKKFNNEECSSSFHADGYYHNILTLMDFPKIKTVPFYGNMFLENDIQNLTIVVNIEPVDLEKLKNKKEKHLRRVRSDVEESNEVSREAGVEALEDQLYRYGKGEEVPLRIEYVLHIWNSDLKDLHSDTMILKQSAINMFTSLKTYDLGLLAMHNFLKTLPGNLFYKHKDALLDCNHNALASLIPFNSSFTGKAKDGNILFSGDHGNIMSIGFFDGGTPQHMLCFGQTGAGKSVNFASILSQSFYYFEKIVIIEEGGSYANLSKIYGDESESIIIDPNGRITLNYFDTGGLPLTKDQIDFVITFLVGMCGESDNAEIRQDREATINPYVVNVYNDVFSEWKESNEKDVYKAARLSLTIEWMVEFMPIERSSNCDIYLELIYILDKNEDELEDFDKNVIEFYNNLSKTELADYILDNSDTLRDISFALIPSSAAPYHSQIVELMRNATLGDAKESESIARRLAMYSVDAGRGCLFDGETSIDLTKKFVHIELSRLASCSETMKNLVGIVVNNLVKNQIIRMPRSDKKLYLFEEAARFLSIPGAAEIMKQTYAQFRKFSCVAVTVTQAIAQMSENGVGQILMTQSKNFMFLKNTDQQELNEIKRYIGLSDAAIDTIMNFPSPEHIFGEKFSSFLYYAQRDQHPIVGVGRNYASKEILVAAATSGELHTKVEKIVKTLTMKNKHLNFAEKILKATELLKEDKKLLQLLSRIEKIGDKKVKALILDAKLEALKIL